MNLFPISTNKSIYMPVSKPSEPDLSMIIKNSRLHNYPMIQNTQTVNNTVDENYVRFVPESNFNKKASTVKIYFDTKDPDGGKVALISNKQRNKHYKD